jgi:tight adherence protein C
MTPLLAGALGALFVAVGLLGVPLLLDRGPLERLAGRAGGAPERRSSLIARVVGGLAGRLGPRVAPSIRGRQRERIAHRLDLAGRPGGLTVQRFIGLKAALATLLGGVLVLMLLAGGSPLLLPLALVVGWFGPDI